MSYAFAPHLTTMVDEALACEARSVGATTCQTFALVDAGQMGDQGNSIRKLLPDVPFELLFEDSFAKSALHLSPVLIELSATSQQRAAQTLAIDKACRHLPAMTLVTGPVALAELVAHLREMLLVESDRSPYLLRFADSQMMSAANSIFTPEQRACFFGELTGWWTVDHLGVADNAADASVHHQARPAVRAPLVLDDAQTDGLLKAVAAPVRASQLRNLEVTFAAALSHAQQMLFAAECLAAAAKQGLDSDADLTLHALQRWGDRLRSEQR